MLQKMSTNGTREEREYAKLLSMTEEPNMIQHYDDKIPTHSSTNDDPQQQHHQRRRVFEVQC